MDFFARICMRRAHCAAAHHLINMIGHRLKKQLKVEVERLKQQLGWTVGR
jgi:hypothetical protein